MPVFKAAYLIHGDDHGRIGERRAKLRALAERESGAGGVEVFEGDAAAPEAIAMSLSSMTFAVGRRFVIVEGVERWKEADVAPVTAAMKGMDPSTQTVAFFGREEGRYKVPAALVKAVKAAGGAIDTESVVKPWELPRWVAAQAKPLGLELDAGAARALVGRVGERQQRLLRELEKLALSHEPGAHLSEEDVGVEAASSVERKAWTLADAVVAGDKKAATRLVVELRGQGERVPSLLFAILRRLRDAHQVSAALAEGQSSAQVRRGLRLPPKAAERLVADAQRYDPEHFQQAIAALADLEVLSRGGGELGEDTAALLTVGDITG